MAEKEKGKRPAGVSRRDFLKGSAVAGLAGPGLLAAQEEKAAVRRVSGAPVVGPEAVPVALTINGETRKLRVEPRVTLLDALRDLLDVTGAKRVCDRGTCGACTVLLDGKPVYACSILALEAEGREVTTVESLGTVESLNPLQAAFVDNDAQQCGFCTPGFVMAATALLAETPNPSEAEIHRALAGNFCRCGTYAGMRKAVAQGGTRGGDHG